MQTKRRGIRLPPIDDARIRPPVGVVIGICGICDGRISEKADMQLRKRGHRWRWVWNGVETQAQAWEEARRQHCARIQTAGRLTFVRIISR